MRLNSVRRPLFLTARDRLHLDLLSLLRLTVRRWIVVVPILIVTFLVLIWMVANREADFQMEGSYLLVASDDVDPRAAVIEPTQAADVLEDVLLSPAVRTRLAEDGFAATYTTRVGSSGTALGLTFTGDSPEVVVDTANALIALAPELLEDTFGDSASTVSLQTLSVPTLADVTQSGAAYSAAISIVVAPLSADSGNPFRANLSTVLSLVRATTSTDFENEIAEMAPGATFEVSNTIRDAALIDIKVNAGSDAAVTAAYAAVRDGLQSELVRLQDVSNVDLDYRTGFRAVVEPIEPTETPASLVRPAAAIVILGTGLAVSLAVLIESFSVARRRGEATGGLRAPRFLTRPFGPISAARPQGDDSGTAVTAAQPVDDSDTAVTAQPVDDSAAPGGLDAADESRRIIYDVEAEDAATLPTRDSAGAEAVDGPVLANSSVVVTGDSVLNRSLLDESKGVSVITVAPSGVIAEAQRAGGPVNGEAPALATMPRSARPTRRPTRKR